MAALIRFFSRRKKKDKLDTAEQRFFHEGHSPVHEPGKLKFHKNDIECKVIHLDGQEMTTYLPKNAVGRQLYDRVFTNFDFTQEFDYFGLQYMDTSNVAQWLDPTKKIKKQLSIGPPYTLHLRVRFFSSEPQSLRDELTRYLFVLQLKGDIQSGALKCDTDLGAELAALCLQSELGDFDEADHSLALISQFRFMPDNQQTEDFEQSALEHFIDLAGRHITPAAADKTYLDKARYLPDYGVDMHCVLGKDGQTYRLGLTPTGILVYDNKQKIGFFFWPWIIKIGFSKSKLKIVVAEKDDDSGVTRDHSFVFSLADPRACKHLWKCCVECHSFFRLTCNNAAGPTGKGSAKLLRMQSRFYSSYRTEFEMRHANMGSSHRRSARFQRVPSRRFSSRASFEKAEALGRKGEGKSKAEKRAELKADTLRMLQEKSDSPKAPGASPSPSGARESSPSVRGAAAGDEAATIPRESLGSTASSASRTHHTLVSVEAKVEPLPQRSASASVTGSVNAGLRSRSSSTSSSSSSASEAAPVVLSKLASERPLAAAPSAAADTGPGDAVLEEPRTRLVASHIPKSIAATARTAAGHASARSAFKPTRLQEESTDEEASPILSRSSSAAVPASSAAAQVSHQEPPSLIPRHSATAPPTAPTTTAAAAAVTSSGSSLPRPRLSLSGPSGGSRIPKMAGMPTSPQPPTVSPPPPTSAQPAVSVQPTSAQTAVSSPPMSAQPSVSVQPTSPPPTNGSSMIPQPPRRPSAPAVKAPGSRIPALMVQQSSQQPSTSVARSNSAVSNASTSSSSSSSASSASSAAASKEGKEAKEEAAAGKDKDTPPPTKIPTLPRAPRGDVKTQFQVETSFASAAVSTSHKLVPSHVRSTGPALANPGLVLVKRAPANAQNGHQPGLACRSVQEQLSTTV